MSTFAFCENSTKEFLIGTDFMENLNRFFESKPNRVSPIFSSVAGIVTLFLPSVAIKKLVTLSLPQGIMLKKEKYACDFVCQDIEEFMTSETLQDYLQFSFTCLFTLYG